MTSPAYVIVEILPGEINDEEDKHEAGCRFIAFARTRKEGIAKLIRLYDKAHTEGRTTEDCVHTPEKLLTYGTYSYFGCAESDCMLLECKKP